MWGGGGGAFGGEAYRGGYLMYKEARGYFGGGLVHVWRVKNEERTACSIKSKRAPETLAIN